MLDNVLLHAPIFLLVFARCFAVLMTLPLFSMRAVPRVAKLALAGYMSFFIFGITDLSVFNPYITEDGVFSLFYVLLVAGEALIGIIIGFYVSIIFAAFSTAGQFTAFQMGFSAASTYDSLAQVENPLMGQFFNFVAMLIFMQQRWFQKLFLGGVVSSFSTLNTLSLIEHQSNIVTFMLKALTKLFADALIIALPIMATLFLITVCTGLLTKAAPQMNLLSEGFPIMILVAFFVLISLMGPMSGFFERSFMQGFRILEELFISFKGGM